MNSISRSIRDRIADHPCYCESAHLRFARMHIPIAPACNMQCAYCDRRHDCVNESRPGVSSEILNPEQARERVLRMAEALPNLRVVGIAGPGDPLANPEAVFESCRLIRETGLDLHLCLSTNGLELPRWVPTLVELGIEHLTVTVNAVDAAIAAQFYDWIMVDERRWHGTEAACLLIERQRLGIEQMVARGGIVKVNTVLAQGRNDAHMGELAHWVQDTGAFVHNIMPLIVSERADTSFRRQGLRPTDSQVLQRARADATAVLGTQSRVMRHCKQCRADAVGLLGQDLAMEEVACKKVC